MEYYEVSYYRTQCWIDKKYIQTELGSSDAIMKARVKNIVDVKEISEERYMECKTRKRDEAKKKKALREDGFIK